MNLIIVGAFLVVSNGQGGDIDYARMGTSNNSIRFESYDECLLEAKKVNAKIRQDSAYSGGRIVVYDCLPILQPAS